MSVISHFDIMTCTLSREHKSFLKENDTQYSALTGDRFFVVEEDSRSWLLKTVDGCIAFPAESEERHRDHTWHNGLPEVYAYRIAAHLGYPIRETKLVLATIQDTRMANRPFLAYEFVKNHSYIRHTDEKFSMSIESVSNKHDVTFRAIFNWLIGSHNDNGRQALLDPEDNKYYAVEAVAAPHAHMPYYRHSAENIANPNYYQEIMIARCNKPVPCNIECITENIINEVLSSKNNYLNGISNLRDQDLVKEILSLQSNVLDNLSRAISGRATALYEVITDKK